MEKQKPGKMESVHAGLQKAVKASVILLTACASPYDSLTSEQKEKRYQDEYRCMKEVKTDSVSVKVNDSKGHSRLKGSGGGPDPIIYQACMKAAGWDR